MYCSLPSESQWMCIQLNIVYTWVCVLFHYGWKLSRANSHISHSTICHSTLYTIECGLWIAGPQSANHNLQTTLKYSVKCTEWLAARNRVHDKHKGQCVLCYTCELWTSSPSNIVVDCGCGVLEIALLTWHFHWYWARETCSGGAGAPLGWDSEWKLK